MSDLQLWSLWYRILPILWLVVVARPPSHHWRRPALVLAGLLFISALWFVWPLWQPLLTRADPSLLFASLAPRPDVFAIPRYAVGAMMTASAADVTFVAWLSHRFHLSLGWRLVVAPFVLFNGWLFGLGFYLLFAVRERR